MKHFKQIKKDIDVSPILQEVHDKPRMWQARLVATASLRPKMRFRQ
jgi:hypothetical protein